MTMALNELAERVRTLLPPSLHCSEKRMFGGIVFMADGNMLVAPVKDGSMLVRVGKEGMPDALALPGASTMTMGNRTMGGFVLISGDAIEDDDALAAWIERAWAFVKTLPPK